MVRQISTKSPCLVVLVGVEYIVKIGFIFGADDDISGRKTGKVKTAAQ